MSIQISDLGFQVSDKIKSAIFKDSILVEGDFVTLLIPLMGDVSLAPEVGAVISRINTLKEEAKDAEIEALKQAKVKASKPKVKGRGSRTFWSDISSEIEELLCDLIDPDFEDTLDWVNTPQFSLESKILSQDNLAYITQSTTGENPFQGLTKKKGGGYNGVCNKIDRKILTKMFTDHVDFQIMAYENGYKILYLLYLILEELFSVDSWSHEVTYKIDQKLSRDNISSQEDWDWLHGNTDTMYEKERTLSWAIDKIALQNHLNGLKKVTEHTLPTNGKIDLESLSYLRKVLYDSVVLNSTTLSKICKHEGKKPTVMLGDTSIETEKPSKKSRLTA